MYTKVLKLWPEPNNLTEDALAIFYVSKYWVSSSENLALCECAGIFVKSGCKFRILLKAIHVFQKLRNSVKLFVHHFTLIYPNVLVVFSDGWFYANLMFISHSEKFRWNFMYKCTWTHCGTSTLKLLQKMFESETVIRYCHNSNIVDLKLFVTCRKGFFICFSSASYFTAGKNVLCNTSLDNYLITI